MRNAIISTYISIIFLFVIGFIVKTMFFSQNNIAFAASEDVNSAQANFNDLDYTHPDKQIANKILIFSLLKDKLLPPKLTFYGVNSQKYTLKNFRNNLVILYFWATWCTECRSEIGTMKNMLERFNYDDVEDIKLIAISRDFKDKTKISEFWQQQGLQEDQLFFDDKDELSDYFQVRSLPTAFLLDKQGHIIARIDKPQMWDDENLQNELKALRKREKL